MRQSFLRSSCCWGCDACWYRWWWRDDPTPRFSQVYSGQLHPFPLARALYVWSFESHPYLYWNSVKYREWVEYCKLRFGKPHSRETASRPIRDDAPFQGKVMLVRFTRLPSQPFSAPFTVLQEAVRVKRLTSKKSAVRDLLFSSIADYNRSTTNKAMNLFSCLGKCNLKNHRAIPPSFACATRLSRSRKTWRKSSMGLFAVPSSLWTLWSNLETSTNGNMEVSCFCFLYLMLQGTKQNKVWNEWLKHQHINTLSLYCLGLILSLASLDTGVLIGRLLCAWLLLGWSLHRCLVATNKGQANLLLLSLSVWIIAAVFRNHCKFINRLLCSKIPIW